MVAVSPKQRLRPWRHDIAEPFAIKRRLPISCGFRRIVAKKQH
jgi:hypothetical protein